MLPSNRAYEASGLTGRPTTLATFTPAGRRVRSVYAKQDDEFRSEHHQVELDHQLLDSQMRAVVALGIAADEGLSIAEDQAMRSEARASSVELAAIEMAPTAIPQLNHIRQVASMQRAALLSAVAESLTERVRRT